VEFFGFKKMRKLNEQVSVLVMIGSHSRFWISFHPKKVLFYSGVVCITLVLSLYLAYVHIVPGEGFFHSDTSALLNDFLKQHSSDNAELAHAQIEAKGNIDQQIKLLAKEYLRIRNYEKQLKERGTTLDLALKDALKLDHSSGQKLNRRAAKNDATDLDTDISASDSPEDSGVGGGGRVSPTRIRSLLPAFRKSILRKSKNTADTVALIDEEIDQLNRIPVGTPVYGKETSSFGWRASPYTGRSQLHEGIDLAVDSKTHVLATGEGTVVEASYKGALGNIVKIDHGNGIETLFGHLAKINVKLGQRVCRGQLIGLVGTTGRATGPHVHYEVQVGGVPKDPAQFVRLARILGFAKI
jgi:murein DD-endopeptidase MepM/ murein hydrolase activator NlpD